MLLVVLVCGSWCCCWCGSLHCWGDGVLSCEWLVGRMTTWARVGWCAADWVGVVGCVCVVGWLYDHMSAGVCCLRISLSISEVCVCVVLCDG